MKSKKIIAIYCRSSRIKTGNTLLLGIESQKTAARKYFNGKKDIEIKYFIDKNISGKKKSRPALDALRKEIERGNISCVVVSDIARIARSLQHLLLLEEDFRSRKVGFISIKEQIDTSTPTGKLIFQIMGAIGEFGSSIAREKSLAVVEECRRKKIILGRRLRENKDSTNSIDPQKLQKIKDLRRDEISFRSIGEILAIPTMTVYRISKRKRKSTA